MAERRAVARWVLKVWIGVRLVLVVGLDVRIHDCKKTYLLLHTSLFNNFCFKLVVSSIGRA